MKANVDPLTYHPLRDARHVERELPHRRHGDDARSELSASLRFRRADDPASPRRTLNHENAKPLIAAIAHELWKLHGGNDVLNWLEAEILLQNALADDDAGRGRGPASD